MPPVISFVVGLTMTPPTPVAAVVTGGFSCAPLSNAERMTIWVVCVPQLTATLVIFAAPMVPAPLVTVQRSLASTTWTL